MASLPPTHRKRPRGSTVDKAAAGMREPNPEHQPYKYGNYHSRMTR